MFCRNLEETLNSMEAAVRRSMEDSMIEAIDMVMGVTYTAMDMMDESLGFYRSRWTRVDIDYCVLYCLFMH